MIHRIDEVRCLLISPSDVAAERAGVAHAVATWNAHMGPRLNARIELVRWEIHGTPDLRGGDGQRVLNRQIVDACDIGVAIFSSRVGTATKRFVSGSVEEIERLRRRGKHVMAYFSSVPPKASRTVQARQLINLKARLERAGLLGMYDNVEDLKYKLQAHLTDAVKGVIEKQPKGTRDTSIVSSWIDAKFLAPASKWRLAATPLPSREVMYGEIAALIKQTRGPLHVRATSTLHDRDRAADEPFRNYVHTIAQQCGARKRRGVASSYTLVLAFTPTTHGLPPAPRSDSLRYRLSEFEAAGAIDAAQILQLPHFGYLDVLTIGERHAIIGFPARANDPRLRYAVRISGRSFVSQIVQWFDTCILPYTRTIDKATLRVEKWREGGDD